MAGQSTALAIRPIAAVATTGSAAQGQSARAAIAAFNGGSTAGAAVLGQFDPIILKPAAGVQATGSASSGSTVAVVLSFRPGGATASSIALGLKYGGGLSGLAGHVEADDGEYGRTAYLSALTNIGLVSASSIRRSGGVVHALAGVSAV